MSKMIFPQFDAITFDDNTSGKLPDSKTIPVSPTEKIVKKELDRLNQSIEELRELVEEVKKKNRE